MRGDTSRVSIRPTAEYDDCVETRELRYFVAVAEELHFGRAAQRLSMAQPPLSRAIQQLERRLGVVLLHRGARAITLTEAGTVLLREARIVLDAVDAAERRTRRAAGGRPGLVLATKSGASPELLSDLLDAYAALPDAVPVEVALCGPGEAERMLRTGQADVALLQRPYDSTSGLDTDELRAERQVLVLPADHAWAGRAQVSMAEIDALVDPPLPRWPQRDGTHADGPGPRVRDHTQLTQLIALGRACALMPESVGTHLPGDLGVVPVPDAPVITTVIAWPPDSRSRALAVLVRAALSGAS